jgi:hypothetical protein
VPARIDPYTLDLLATVSTRARLAALTVTDLDRPTATTDWDIRALLSHLVGGNLRFARALRGEPADWPTRDEEPITSPLEEFDTMSTPPPPAGSLTRSTPCSACGLPATM